MSRGFSLRCEALKVEPQKSIETRPPSPTCEGNAVLETINGSRMFNDLHQRCLIYVVENIWSLSDSCIRLFQAIVWTIDWF